MRPDARSLLLVPGLGHRGLRGIRYARPRLGIRRRRRGVWRPPRPHSLLHTETLYMSRTSLLILGHGSREASANAEFEHLVGMYRARRPSPFPRLSWTSSTSGVHRFLRVTSHPAALHPCSLDGRKTP